MAARKFNATWDNVATLDADHIACWGAFEGYVGSIAFDGAEPREMDAVHDEERDVLTVRYFWRRGAGAHRAVHSVVKLDRRPCRFGGTRAYFICPSCARRTLRLAVLRSGLLCGRCGRITWASRRMTKTQRLVLKANKIAARLGARCWTDLMTRPSCMRLETFFRLLAELETVKIEINRRIGARMARSRWGRGKSAAWSVISGGRV